MTDTAAAVLDLDLPGEILDELRRHSVPLNDYPAVLRCLRFVYAPPSSYLTRGEVADRAAQWQATADKHGYYSTVDLPLVLCLGQFWLNIAVELALIPPKQRLTTPKGTVGTGWSKDVGDWLVQRSWHIWNELGSDYGFGAPIGSARAATQLGEQHALPVTRSHVLALHDRGFLAKAGTYRDYPTFLPHHLRRLPADLVAETVAGPQWAAEHPDRVAAAMILGVSPEKFDLLAPQHGLVADRIGRYDRAAVDAVDRSVLR